MLTRVLTFTGVECYDLIIYLARVYKQLEQSVLIADNSTSQSLSHCVPGLIDAQDGIPIDFGGITATKHLEQIPTNFNYVIIYTGKHPHDVIYDATDVFLVADYQKHNVEQLIDIELDEDVDPTLIFRDRVTAKITPDTIMSVLSSRGINAGKVYHTDDTLEDLTARVLCQYNYYDNFKKVSGSIKQFLLDVISADFDEKIVSKALKQASRGW